MPTPPHPRIWLRGAGAGPSSKVRPAPILTDSERATPAEYKTEGATSAFLHVDILVEGKVGLIV